MNFALQLTARGLMELPLAANHAEMAGFFASANNDPWDRLLAAQACIEQVELITGDSKMDDFGVRAYWQKEAQQ